MQLVFYVWMCLLIWTNVRQLPWHVTAHYNYGSLLLWDQSPYVLGKMIPISLKTWPIISNAIILIFFPFYRILALSKKKRFDLIYYNVGLKITFPNLNMLLFMFINAMLCFDFLQNSDLKDMFLHQENFLSLT